MARTSYIDPRVFDRFDGGLTIAGVLPDLAEDGVERPEVRGAIEQGVLDLLAEDTESAAVERSEALAEELEEVAA